MLQRPAFQPHYHVEIVEGEGIVLLSEKDHSLLPGRLYEIVARWIDGRRSADDIVAQLRDQASSAEVYETLAQLEQQGFLSESDETVPAGEAALWTILGITPRTAAHRLQETPVSVR